MAVAEMFPLILAQAGIQTLGPRFRGSEPNWRTVAA
jgi:hypothetical protein